MRNLLVLAELKNFARAAKALNISQPTLSRSIQSLEKTLDCKLFERTNKGVYLTSAGEIIHRHASLILASSEAMQAELNQYQGVMTGSLNIGAGSYIGNALLPDTIARFCALYPQIKMNITVLDWDRLGEKISQTDFDFVLMESTELADGLPIEKQALSRHQAFFYCRDNHPLLLMKNPRFTDLLCYTLLMPALPQRVKQLFAQLRAQENNSGESGELNQEFNQLYMGDQAMVQEIVRKTDYLALGAFNLFKTGYEEGHLKIVPIIINQLRMHSDILIRKRLSLSPAAIKFIELLKIIDAEQAQQVDAFIQTTEFKRFSQY